MTATVKLGEHNHIQVTGNINFDNVTELTAQGQSLINDRNDVVVDLANVTRVNSAGLVLLLAWLRFAKQNNINLQFANVPASLKAIAKLTALEPLLWTN